MTVCATVVTGPNYRVEAQSPPAPLPAADAAPAPATTEALSKPAALPSNIYPTSPLAQVVRMAQAGVDPSVIMTFITNSSSTFNLDSDKIIYASDAGVTSAMVTAMMQRDQILQQQFAASQAALQAQSAPQPQPVPPAAETAPPNVTDVTSVPAPDQPVTVNYFYNTLQPYGSWVYVAGYGNCWRPTVCVYNPGWQPYCDRGQWVYTDCGWYWNSSYAWGATFHYGRWFQSPGYGWCWYPDTVWAPSWVTWRYSNNYCGWAPLPPGTGYQAGVGIVYNGSGVSVGFGFGLGASCFTFVPTQYFCSSHPRNYCVPPAQVTQIYNNTTIINNYNFNNHTIVNHGIEVNNIAAGTHTPIRPVPVHELNSGYYAHGGYGRPAVNPGQSSGVTHTGNSSVTIGMANTTPIRYSQPAQNWTAPSGNPPQHNDVVTTIPQRSMPPANPSAVAYNTPRPEPARSNWQPTWPVGTPRGAVDNNGPRPNYSAPQHTAPASAPAPAPSQQGGYHSGGPAGPMH